MVVGVPRLLLTWQLILNLDAIDSSRCKDSAAYSNYTLSLRLICRRDWREQRIEGRFGQRVMLGECSYQVHQTCTKSIHLEMCPHLLVYVHLR